MKFDVIIGNPPYQLSNGGGKNKSSGKAIYHLFVEQAKKLNPNYICMIIPARWLMADDLIFFRESMTKDNHLEVFHKLKSIDCFPALETPIKGDICYFLWNKKYNSDLCEINIHENNEIKKSYRNLIDKNINTFILDNETNNIIQKIIPNLKEFNSFGKIISSNDPFGFDIREVNSFKRIKPDFDLIKSKEKNIKFFYNQWRSKGIGFVDYEKIRKNKDLVNSIKVYLPKAWGDGNRSNDWIKPFLEKNPSCATETYLMIAPIENQEYAENIISYTQTKFFHFCVFLKKNTQNAMAGAYQFVPLQHFNESWTDEKLYAKYNLTDDEIAYIESMIRPMNTGAIQNVK